MPWETIDIANAEPLHVLGMEWIGRKLRRRRNRLGLTQRQLEALADVDQTVISRMENGRVRGIRFGRFARLVGAMGGLDESDPIPPWLGSRSRRRPAIVDLMDLPDLASEPDPADEFGEG